MVFTLPAPIANIAYTNKGGLRLLFDVAPSAADHRQTPGIWGAHRRDAGAVHLGLGVDAPPARARHRARRRALARRALVACRPDSSCRCGCCHGCSGAVSSKNCSGCMRRSSCGSSANTWTWLTPSLRGLARADAQDRVGGLRQAGRLPDRGGAGLPVALHAPGGDLQQPPARLDERGVTFRWKDYRAKGAHALQGHDAGAPEGSCAASCCIVLPGGSIASAHYGLLANGHRRHNLATVRRLLLPPAGDTECPCDTAQANTERAALPTFVCGTAVSRC